MKTIIQLLVVAVAWVPAVAFADLSKEIKGLWTVETQKPSLEEMTRHMFKKMGLDDTQVKSMVAAMPKQSELTQIFEITDKEFRQTSKSSNARAGGSGSMSIGYEIKGDRLYIRIPGAENLASLGENPLPEYYTIKVKGNTMTMTSNPMAYLGKKPIVYKLKRKTKAEVRKTAAARK